MVGQQVIVLPPPALQGAGRLLQIPVLLQLPAGRALQVGQQQHLLWGISLQAHGSGQGSIDVTHLACSKMGMYMALLVQAASGQHCSQLFEGAAAVRNHKGVVREKGLHRVLQSCLRCLHLESRVVPGLPKQSRLSNTWPERILDIASLGWLKHVPEGPLLPRPCSQQLPWQVRLVRAASCRTVTQTWVQNCRQTCLCLAAAYLTAPSYSLAEAPPLVTT